MKVTNLLTGSRAYEILKNYVYCCINFILLYDRFLQSKGQVKRVLTRNKLNCPHNGVLVCSRLSVSGDDLKRGLATGRVFDRPMAPLTISQMYLEYRYVTLIYDEIIQSVIEVIDMFLFFPVMPLLEKFLKIC